MNVEMAQILALRALGFIASDEMALRTLLTQTGLTADEIRAAAAESEFQAGVLDFLTRHEELLVSFCESEEITPIDITKAHQALAGAEPERSI